ILPLLLRYMRGTRLLGWSVWIGVVSFALFLLMPYPVVKYALLAVFSFVEANWYPLGKGQAYASQPDKSGVVLSVTSLLSPITSLLPLLVGVVATQFGLSWGLVVLLVGPVVGGGLLLVRGRE